MLGKFWASVGVPDKSISAPLCKNCRWYDAGIAYAKCRSPKNEIDIVEGGPEVVYCNINRMFMSACGPSGKLFEPKVAA